MDQDELNFLRPYEEQDADIILRRYLNLERFKDLIETKTLYFAPASAFEDELEGHYTDYDYQAWDQQLAGWGFSETPREWASEAKSKIARHNRQAVVINCWTQGIDEDPRMWKEYGRSNESIAIQTTVGKLRASLGSEFLIISVRYPDFQQHAIPKEHSLQPFFFKRLCFSWEREVRVICQMELGKRLGTPRRVAVDLGSLVQRIIVSPTAPPGFAERIKSLTGECLPLMPVEASSLR